MDKPVTTQTRKKLLLVKILKGFVLYAFVPYLLLRLMSQPVGDAVRRSDPAAWWIILAAMGAVILNWFVYAAIYQRRPSLLVFAHGVLCLLIVVFIGLEALPGYYPLATTLATVGGSLALVYLLLLSSWFASRRSKAALSTAVCIRVLLGVIFCSMVYRVIRDIEIRHTTRDTWITAGFLAALVLAFNIPRFLASSRRARERRRATGEAEGRIVQIIGESRFNRDDELVTDYHARVQYTADDTLYETKADISRLIVRMYNRDTFVGRTIAVCYDPENPADAYVKKISRRMIKQWRKSDKNPSGSEEKAEKT